MYVCLYVCMCYLRMIYQTETGEEDERRKQAYFGKEKLSKLRVENRPRPLHAHTHTHTYIYILYNALQCSQVIKILIKTLR